jgi:hypothetical protein
MTMAQSTTVFEAVASHNLEGVAKEYLKAARTSILGYLTFQERCRPRNEEVKNGESELYSVRRNHVVPVPSRSFCGSDP